MDLQTRSLTIKVSSLVDKKIIELCVKWSRDPGSVVAVLSPNQKILSSVFIYGKPVRNNTEILFLRPVHTGMNIGARYSPAFFNAFFVFTPKRFSLTMSRVNMQIHSLTLDGA